MVEEKPANPLDSNTTIVLLPTPEWSGAKKLYGKRSLRTWGRFRKRKNPTISRVQLA
jgi:hypothetical protein